MAEDIEIGADTSQAVSAIGNIAKAFEEAARASGASTKAINASLRSTERAVGGLVADLAKQDAARRSNIRTISEEITAEQKLAAARRASQNTGLKTNSAGRVINASTGQYANDADSKVYQNQIALAERLAQRQGQVVLGNQAAVRAFSDQSTAIGRLVTQESELDRVRSRSTRQLQLQQAFSSRFYGVADQGATRMQRLANVLNQIPPATWAAKLGDAQARITNMSNSTRYALYDVSNSFGIAGAAILGFGVLSVATAIKHERAFANVERTTQTSAEGYAYLQRQLEQMSMTLPVTFEELTQIASAAGQLGISSAGIASFTSTVAKLSATTNLTSDAAGVALARFRAFFAEVGADKGLNVTENTFSNLASSILKVGVNSIATESGIVNVATQIASMGQYAGFTANQTIGLAGALSSIGVAPELSRGTITRTFSLIGTAVSKGGDQLEAFANLAGISSDEFAAAWGTERFAGVFTSMINGLYDVTQSGQDANLMLMDLGFNSVRDRPLLLRLAGAANEAGEAGGLLAQTMEDAYAGWVANSELALQYNKISQTTAARLQVLGQAFEQLFASMGNNTGGFVGELASQLTLLVRGFEAFSQTDAGQVIGTVAANAAILGGALLLIISAGARVVASLQGIGAAWQAMSAVGVSSLSKISQAFKILNLSLGVIGLVATIASIVGGFLIMQDAAAKANRGVQDFDGLVGAMAEDAKNGSDGIYFFSQATKDSSENSKAAAEQARGMAEALSGTGESADAAAGGVDRLTSASKRAVFVFGDAARQFYKSQLAQSPSFQDLFDPTRKFGSGLDTFFGGGLTLDEIGISPGDIDFNELMTESVKNGKIDRDALYKQLTDKIGISAADLLSGEEGSAEKMAGIQNLLDSVEAIYNGLTPEIQATINAQAALGTTAKQTFAEMVDGGADAATMLGQLSEEAQKTAEATAQGFAKFTDIGTLIGLTQTMVSDSETAAEDYAKAWEDAYGGASFKLGDYLENFRKAAGEQQTFIGNLQQLSVRGLSDGIISELSAMGPQAASLVDALVKGTDEQLDEFEELWGQTGYDSMVQFAVQSELASGLVRNVLANAGEEGLQRFNAALSSGKGVEQALADLQLDINGHPIKVTPQTNRPANLTWAQKKVWEEQNRLTVTGRVNLVTPILNGAGLKIGSKTITPYAEGGYTGPGGKWEEAGVVHKGEFVMTAKATRALGVGNLYALMRQAQGGRSAPKGRGYANGGLVGGVQNSGLGTMMVYLSPEDRELIRSIQPSIRIGDRDIAQAQFTADSRSTRHGVG